MASKRISRKQQHSSFIQKLINTCTNDEDKNIILRYQHLLRRDNNTFAKNIREIEYLVNYKYDYIRNYSPIDIRFILFCNFKQAFDKPNLTYEELRILSRRFSLSFPYVATQYASYRYNVHKKNSILQYFIIDKISRDPIEQYKHMERVRLEWTEDQKQDFVELKPFVQTTPQQIIFDFDDYFTTDLDQFLQTSTSSSPSDASLYYAGFYIIPPESQTPVGFKRDRDDDFTDYKPKRQCQEFFYDD